MHEATPRNRRRTGDNIGDRHRWMPGELHHCGLADPDAGVITAAVNELKIWAGASQSRSKGRVVSNRWIA